MLFKEFLAYAFWDQNVGPGWIKNDKKMLFLIPAGAGMLFSTQFSLIKKFLTAIVP